MMMIMMRMMMTMRIRMMRLRMRIKMTMLSMTMTMTTLTMLIMMIITMRIMLMMIMIKMTMLELSPPRSVSGPVRETLSAPAGPGVLPATECPSYAPTTTGRSGGRSRCRGRAWSRARDVVTGTVSRLPGLWSRVFHFLLLYTVSKNSGICVSESF